MAVHNRTINPAAFVNVAMQAHAAISMANVIVAYIGFTIIPRFLGAVSKGVDEAAK
jgi:hypothetical protein